MDLHVMGSTDLDGAVDVWREANIARGKPPTPERVARVIEKLQEPGAVAYVVEDGRIVAMVLTEPFRADDGAGAIVPGGLHISMVFVSPPRQRQGVGGNLMRHTLAAARAAGASSVQLWTDRDNTPARRLYERIGMKPVRARRVGEGEWTCYEMLL